MQVGLLLIVLPWWPAFWEQNYFAVTWPPLRSVLANNFVRGAVSGLGFVNLFAGFADLALMFTARPPRTPGSLAGRGPDEMPLGDGASRS